jgi:hypothetical protein
VVKSINGSPKQGFKVIKAKVSNVTAAINGAAQNMSDGVLVAVAKFHRNTCYTENLSGEWGSPDTVASYGSNVFNPPAAVPPVPGAPPAGCRTAEEEIVVSAQQPPVTLDAGAAAKVMTFDFSSNPIPINATDLKLQVVYRGFLGTEQDAVVVETVDINEPYFTSYTNATDNLLCVANTWYVRDANGNFPESVGAYGSTIMDDVKIAYEPGDATPEIDPLIKIIVVADPDASTLKPNQAIRFAVLAPLGTKWGIHWKEITVNLSIDESIFPDDLTVYANQVYWASGGAGKPPVLKKRARDVYKARNAYSAAGEVFRGGDGSSCDIKTLPVDPNPPPELLPVRIMKAPFNQ